jgi:hypothetical protein
MLSLGRSMAVAGSDADMAIERCSGESGLAATLRIEGVRVAAFGRFEVAGRFVAAR